MTDRDEMRGRAFEENCETVKEMEAEIRRLVKEKEKAVKRDEMAKAAMKAMIISGDYYHETYAEIVRRAYKIADAMLKESAWKDSLCGPKPKVEVGMCGSFGPFDIWGKLTHIEKDADFPFWRDNEVGYDSFTPGPAPLVDENGRLIEEK